MIGVLTAVLLGKQVFGGLGYNPFNPAMVGYVVLLISFPVQMSSWAVPRELGAVPGIAEALQRVFLPGSIDALTGATPLDLLRQNTGLLFDDLMKTRPELSSWAGWAGLKSIWRSSRGGCGSCTDGYSPGTRPLPCWQLWHFVH